MLSQESGRFVSVGLVAARRASSIKHKYVSKSCKTGVELSRLLISALWRINHMITEHANWTLGTHNLPDRL